MHFFMIIGKNYFYLYSLNDGILKPEFIDGNPFWKYNQHSIKKDVLKLMNTVADANNLENSKAIKISVVLNSDRVRNVNTLNALSDRVTDKIILDDVLMRVIEKLLKNESLRIDEFGINYDGESYLLHNGKLRKSAYNLLAYTLKQEEFISGIQER